MAVVYRGNRGGGTAPDAGGQNNVTVPVLNNCAPGSLVLLLFAINGSFGGSPTAQSFDSQGNLWSVDKIFNVGGVAVGFFSSVLAKPLIGGTDAVYLHGLGGSNNVVSSGATAWSLEEFANVHALSRVDVAGASTSGSGTALSTPGTGTLAQADEVVVSAWAVAAAQSSFAPGGAASAFPIQSANAMAFVGQYQITASTGAVTPSATVGTTGAWGGATVTYKGGADPTQERLVAPGLLTR